MGNLILKDISDIDKELGILHSEGASLRALQQQHDDDIKKRNEGIEAEYASTPSHMAVMSDVRFSSKSFYLETKKLVFPLDDWLKIDYIIYELKKYEGSIQDKLQ